MIYSIDGYAALEHAAKICDGYDTNRSDNYACLCAEAIRKEISK